MTKKKMAALLCAMTFVYGGQAGQVYAEAVADIGLTAFSAARQTAPQVIVTGGRIFGYVDEHGVSTFKGIPFAASTAGKNRFRPPQPVEPWQGVKNCTSFGPIAVQPEASTLGGASPWTEEYLDLGMNLENGKMSEDCLSLNVWTKARPGEKRPVIVYIHGGANMSGSSQNDVYTGQDISQKGVVYVSINYRVGIFGFLAYRDKTGEEASGNYALMDQIAALRWVQENIASFGGDPGNVTIMGQSAGSTNVQNLIASPAAAGLFQKAVALSFNNVTTDYPVFMEPEKAKAEAGKALGERTLEELRSMSAKEILSLGYTPTAVVRGTETESVPLPEAFATGRWNRVSMIWGGVAGDPYIFDGVLSLGNAFEPLNSISDADYVGAVRKGLGAEAGKALSLYPAGKDALGAARAVNNDYLISSYFEAARQKDSSDGNFKTYIYFYDHVLPDTPERKAKNGAFHTSDVNYWLNHYTKAYPRNWTEADYALGEAMSSYLVNFASTGNPNGRDHYGKKLPLWKAADASKDIAFLHLGDKVRWEEMDHGKSEFWKKHRK